MAPPTPLPNITSQYGLPYKSGPSSNSLTAYDIHTPLPSSSSNTSSLQEGSKGTYIIHIHGGAWRDPLRTSLDIRHSLPSLPTPTSPSSTSLKIAGVISINYSLSSHPSHPPADEVDEESRSAKHPRHIHDVVDALNHVVEKYGIGSDYVIVGHSCGATLALQAFLPSTWSSPSAAERHEEGGRKVPLRPRAVVCLNGLYDLKKLVREPGDQHNKWEKLYEEVVTGAFGTEEGAWDTVSPACAVLADGHGDEHKPEDGGEEILVKIMDSPSDSLVPPNQAEAMLIALKDSEKMGRSGLGRVKVRKEETRGDHNVVWEDGDVAGIVLEVLKEMDGERA